MTPAPRIFDDPESLAEAAAQTFTEIVLEAHRARGLVRVAFPGGRTPRLLLERLAAPPWRDQVPWRYLEVLLTDERAVPPDHPDNNGRMLREALLAHVPVPGPRVHPWRSDAADLELAAREYERVALAPIDLIVLGVGEDGHIASLFPGSRLLAESGRATAAVENAPKLPARRLTLTPLALRLARHVLVLASGWEKAAAVRAAQSPGATPDRVPAALVRDAEWLVDRAAAGR